MEPLTLTNYNHWQNYCRNVTSPQSFIDFSFYALISAALQRRVWMGDTNPNTEGNLYMNVNVILVGPPGCGKGRAIIPAASLIAHPRIDLETGKIIEPSAHDEDSSSAKENFLFPKGPDTITFEALTRKMASSIRRLDYVYEEKHKVYSHSSMYFMLEELSTLLQHDTKKISDFLLKAFDCTDYRRETKTSGVDQVKKPYLTILAGTTATYLEENFSNKLLGDGLAARIWFIYEHVNRFNKFESPALDVGQRESRQKLLDHIKGLATVFGRVDFTPEANAYLTDWWESDHGNGEFPKRANNNMKLDSYFARKVIYVKKLATMLTFSEHLDLFEIPLSYAKRALAILADAEKRMHLALTFGGRNPLGSVSKAVLQFMFNVRRGVTFNELLDEFNHDAREMELKEVLRMLTDTKKIRVEGGKYFNNIGSASKSNVVPLPRPEKPLETIGSDLPALPLDDKEKEVI